MDSLSLSYLYSLSGILINLDFVLPDGSLSVNFDPAMVRALTPINPKRPHPREKGPPPGAKNLETKKTWKLFAPRSPLTKVANNHVATPPYYALILGSRQKWPIGMLN